MSHTTSHQDLIADLSAAHAAMRADLAEAARRGLTVPDLRGPGAPS